MSQGSHEDELPLQKAGFNVIWTDNVDPYKKRKVRILNGAHTSMVLGAHLYGLKTVGECLKDEKVSALLKKCIFDEIIPTIGDNEDNRKFGAAVLERFSGYTRLRCQLETGRTHQIRVHLAYLGHPILGDTVYGPKKPVPGLQGQCLHAVGLRFLHPRTGETVELRCPLPEEFQAVLRRLAIRR